MVMHMVRERQGQARCPEQRRMSQCLTVHACTSQRQSDQKNCRGEATRTTAAQCHPVGETGYRAWAHMAYVLCTLATIHSACSVSTHDAMHLPSTAFYSDHSDFEVSFCSSCSCWSVLHVAAVSLPWTSRHRRAGSDGATSVHTLPYNGNTHYQNWTLVYRCLEP